MNRLIIILCVFILVLGYVLVASHNALFSVVVIIASSVVTVVALGYVSEHANEKETEFMTKLYDRL